MRLLQSFLDRVSFGLEGVVVMAVTGATTAAVVVMAMAVSASAPTPQTIQIKRRARIPHHLMMSLSKYTTTTEKNTENATTKRFIRIARTNQCV